MKSFLKYYKMAGKIRLMRNQSTLIIASSLLFLGFGSEASAQEKASEKPIDKVQSEVEVHVNGENEKETQDWAAELKKQIKKTDGNQELKDNASVGPGEIKTEAKEKAQENLKEKTNEAKSEKLRDMKQEAQKEQKEKMKEQQKEKKERMKEKQKEIKKDSSKRPDKSHNVKNK